MTTEGENRAGLTATMLRVLIPVALALVVGGSGQIGGWLLRTLADRGHEAVGTYLSVPQDRLVPLDASRREEAAGLLRGMGQVGRFFGNTLARPCCPGQRPGPQPGSRSSPPSRAALRPRPTTDSPSVARAPGPRLCRAPA